MIKLDDQIDNIYIEYANNLFYNLFNQMIFLSLINNDGITYIRIKLILYKLNLKQEKKVYFKCLLK